MKAATPAVQVARFWSHIDKSGGPAACWPWMLSATRNGYGRCNLGGRYQDAHRLAYQISRAVVLPRHLLVCHRCDNRICCNPGHLFRGTHLENMADMVAKGRQHKGPRDGICEHAVARRRCRPCRAPQDRKDAAARRARRGLL